MVIKVLHGCGVNGSYWVFAGGLTNVRTALTVTDTATGKSRTYVNPQRRRSSRSRTWARSRAAGNAPRPTPPAG